MGQWKESCDADKPGEGTGDSAKSETAWRRGQSAFSLKGRLQECCYQMEAPSKTLHPLPNFACSLQGDCLSLTGTKLLQILAGVHETDILEFVFLLEKKKKT